MSELNDVSVAIGGLQSDVKNVNNNVEHLIVYIKENIAATQKKLEEHDAQISELQTFRNKVYGIAAAIGVVTSAVGQYLWRKTT
jgi:hypothetical protein